MSDNKKQVVYAYRALKSTQVGRTLKKLRELYIDLEEPEFLVIPYILTCSAYLEARLNDALQDSEDQHGETLASVYVSASLPNKLKMLVPVLTASKYEINKEHFVFQRLMSLIRVRNSITHAKSELKEFSIPEGVAPQSPLQMFGTSSVAGHIPREKPDMTLGGAKTFTPLDYHDALDKLDKWFFQRCPDRLSKVAMVKSQENAPKWEKMHATFVKHLD